MKKMKLKKNEFDVIWLHVLFGVVAFGLLKADIAMPVGLRLCVLVVFYNLLLPLWSLLREHREWFRIWAFLLPLSVFQIFPDWFLASQLNVLVFPDTGAPYVGAVPVFMAGLWVIPLFVVVLSGRYVKRSGHKYLAGWASALVALVLFVGSEMVLWRVPVWQTQNVTMVAHVALYLILPEILLGVYTYQAYEALHRRSFVIKLGAAFSIMLLYLGGLSFFYFVFERLGWFQHLLGFG